MNSGKLSGPGDLMLVFLLVAPPQKQKSNFVTEFSG